MLDKIVDSFAIILKNIEIQSQIKEGGLNLAEAILIQDPFAGINAAKNLVQSVVAARDAIFWDKCQRYLMGTFHSQEDQERWTSKFDESNQSYKAFVKRTMQVIDQLDDDQKVDYFANLTKSYLYEELDKELYFRLAKFLSMSTSEELLYISQCHEFEKYQKNAMISLLYRNGLFDQDVDDKSITTYVLSDYAKALKQHSLNYNDSFRGLKKLGSYADLRPLEISKAATWDEINNVIQF